MFRLKEKSYLVTIIIGDFSENMIVNAKSKSEAIKKAKKVITNSNLWDTALGLELIVRKYKKRDE